MRTPEQTDRWTWLVVAAYSQLRLARGLIADTRLPGQRPQHPNRLTPTRVRRGFPRLRATLGTRPPRETLHAVLGDLGDEGEADLLHTPIKRTADGASLTDDQRALNMLHAATRALAERGNALLKTTFTALRHVSRCPWRIGAITAAALVLLHHQHDRTT